MRPQQITFSVLPRPEAGQGSGDPGPSFQAADLVSFVADANRLVVSGPLPLVSLALVATAL